MCVHTDVCTCGFSSTCGSGPLGPPPGQPASHRYISPFSKRFAGQMERRTTQSGPQARTFMHVSHTSWVGTPPVGRRDRGGGGRSQAPSWTCLTGDFCREPHQWLQTRQPIICQHQRLSPQPPGRWSSLGKKGGRNGTVEACTLLEKSKQK